MAKKRRKPLPQRLPQPPVHRGKKQPKPKRMFTTWAIRRQNQGIFELEDTELHYLGYRKQRDMIGDEDGKRGKLFCVFHIQKFEILPGLVATRYRFKGILLEDLSGKYGMNLQEWRAARNDQEVRETPIEFILSPDGNRYSTEGVLQTNVSHSIIPADAAYIPGGDIELISPALAEVDSELSRRLGELFWMLLDRIPGWVEQEKTREAAKAQAKEELKKLKQSLSGMRSELSELLGERSEAGRRLAEVERELEAMKRNARQGACFNQEHHERLQQKRSRRFKQLRSIRDRERKKREAIAEIEAQCEAKETFLNS